MSRSTEYVITSAGSPESDVTKPSSKGIVQLWKFLLELLADERCRSLITWSREAHGEFKFKKPGEVARRWGLFKHRPGMNYKNFCRSLRYYYDQGIIKKVPGQRLVYKFDKLPSQYTLGKTRSGSKVCAVREEANDFNTLSLCRKESLDKSERLLTDKEKFKKFLQERLTRKIKKPSPLEQIKQMPYPAASPEFSAAPDQPKVQPIVPIPIRPLQLLGDQYFYSPMFPFSVYKQLDPILPCAGTTMSNQLLQGHDSNRYDGQCFV